MSNNKAPLWVCAMVFVCGVLAYAVTGTIDVLSAVATTIDSVFTAVKAAGMFLFSGVAIGVASLAGFCFRSRKRLVGFALLAFVMPFMCYSMQNGIRYVGGQSTAKARLVEARRQQNVDLANLQNQQAIEGRAWLRRTYTQTKDKSEKDKLLAQAVAPVELKAANIEAEIPDAGASVLADIFHVDEATVEKWSAIAFPVLLVLAKVFAPLIAFTFWPVRKAETFSKIEAPTGSDKQSSGKHSSGGEIIDFPLTGKGKQPPPKLSSEPVETLAKTMHAPSIEIIDFPLVGKGKACRPTAANDATISDEAQQREKLSTSIRREEALLDLRNVIAQSGDVPSQRTLSIRWGVREGTVSKWCAHWERSGKVSRRKSGKCQEVQLAQFAILHPAGRA
jgi:hypothetical protein